MLTPRSALELAAWFGLAGGLIDLGVMVAIKRYWYHHNYYWQGSFFPWAIPVANLVVLLVPGLIVAGVARAWRGLVSHRAAAWMFATLALWGPLLRFPVIGWASLLLAAGLGRRFGLWVGVHPVGFGRFARPSLVVLVGVVGALAAATTGRRVVAEWRATAALPPPPAGARNVLLVVLDTVRAQSLGLYGRDRATSPQLERWARRGVRFERALAPAPWTFPSHASFFTGQWPHRVGLEWEPSLPPGVPTIAGNLAARGYRTAGFCANTMFCSYETGLDRGFAHFEDYHLSPRAVLASSPIGRWVLRQALGSLDVAELKWLRFQSRPAPEIRRSFRDWLGDDRRGGRPFFAFLNFIDAHEPFVLSEASRARIGLGPESAADRLAALDYWTTDKRRLNARDVRRAIDAYEDCITFLDREVGALLDDLDRRGVLRDTLVIITSDHGEQFGEHGGFNHGYSLYLQETHVPLLILGPSTPAGRVVPDPVSLRDLPATIMDLVGDTGGRPFPGRSLAEHWRPRSGSARPATSAALSEVVNPLVLNPRNGLGPRHRGFVTSVVAGGEHYIRDGASAEELYGVAADPSESWNLKDEPEAAPLLQRSRRRLGDALADDAATGGGQPAFLRQYREILDREGGGIASEVPHSR
ncbi:MAG TPA: sulfatase [Isosphaeraceae bacterium]|nr:sulfatase [Isosphaeraceae bacterium]